MKKNKRLRIDYFIWISLSALACIEVYALPPLEEVVVTGVAVERPKEDYTSLIGQAPDTSVQIEHPSQILNDVPGVWVHRGNGQEMLTAIRSPVLTGAGACGAFWVGEQGVALRSAGFCNLNQLFEAHTEAAKTVTVFKGPHSVYHGSNAQFGSINVQLPLADEIRPSFSLIGSDRGFRQLQAGYGGQSGANAFGGILTVKEDDAWREDSGYKQHKATFAHRWQKHWTSIDTQLTITNLEQETAAFVEGDEAYRDRGLREQNAEPNAYRDAQAIRLQSRIRKRSVDHEWVLQPYLRSTRMDFLMHFLPWQPIEENGHDAVGFKVLRKRYWAGGFDTYWGLEAEYTEGFLSEIQTGPAPFGQDRFPQGIHYDYSVQATHVAAQAGGYAPILRTPFTVDVGVRYDIDRYDYSNHTESGSACADGVEGCRFFRPEDREDDFKNASAHFGFLYQQAYDKPELFLRWSRGFRLPQATELYRAQSEANVFPEEESIRSIELGVRSQQDRLSYAFAFFRMQNSNGIFQDPQRLYVNGARTEHRGFEYEFSYYWLNQRLRLGANGTIAKHLYRNNPSILGGGTLSGNRIDSAPSSIHRLTLAWSEKDWMHELKVDDLGGYYLDPQNTERYSGHTLVSLQSQWQMNEAWRWRVGIVNLTDRLAADRADLAFGVQRYFPSAPRTVYLGVSAAWR